MEASPRRTPRRPRCALQFYALGLVGYSIVRIVSPAFYALQQSRIPVIASMTSVVVNVLLNVVLVRVMGYAGLALGTSLAAIVNAAASGRDAASAAAVASKARQLAFTFVKVARWRRSRWRPRLV